MKSITKSFGKKMLSFAVATAMAVSMFVTGVYVPMKASAESGPGAWQTDFENIDDLHEYAQELNNQLMGEGNVLLKNNGVLPLREGTSMTIIGTRSYDIVTGGTGSGGSGGIDVDLPTAMANAGFKVNPLAKPLYDTIDSKASISGGLWGSRPTSTVETSPKDIVSLEDSFHLYDTVIWTIARTGGEGTDLFTNTLETNEDPTKHVLELDDNELATLEYLTGLKEKGTIEKVIVLMNVANVIEMGILEDSDTVDAILWIGQPGPTGLDGVGQILNGEYNPSGRTVDIWTADHKQDPTWVNFGDYSQNSYDEETGTYLQTPTNGINDAYDSEGNPVAGTQFVEYEEGIYLGYRYYETAAAEAASGNYEGFVYDEQVIYPFGYGLSYTTFAQEIVTEADALESAINAASGLDDKVSVQVKVTNTGKVAGKEVAQLYVHAPYFEGGIEKAEVTLVSFAKTDILEPGESQVLMLDIRVGDIASFDYNDANKNDYKGWEIEAGDYEFRLQENSHNEIDSLAVTLTAKTTSLDNDDDATNNTPLSNGDDFDTLINIKDKDSEGTMKMMSRSDFAATFPTAPGPEDRVFGDRVVDIMSIEDGTAGEQSNEGRYSGYYNSSDDRESDPWYKTTEDIPAGWTQATAEDAAKREGGKTAVQLKDMADLDYWSDEVIDIDGHPYDGKTEAAAWIEFMNQLTYDEMETLLVAGGYKTPGLAAAGKDQASDKDGPSQLGSGFNYCCEVVISSTWNTGLVYKQGILIGNDSLFLNVPGWYGPAMNTHRSPFTGRNFEYYSQDPVQGGVIAAAVVSGFQTKGGYVYIKHFAINDQETERRNLSTFLSEQTAREIYLKPFEYAVKDGGAKGIMTCFNRIGVIPGSGCYPLMQTITVEEWGFRGQYVSDYYYSDMGKANFLVRSGNMPLGTYSGLNNLTGEWDDTLRDGMGNVRDGNVGQDGKMPESSTQYYAVRMAATKIMWVGANTNVNENGLDKSAFAAQTVNFVEQISGSANIAANTEKLGSENVKYSVTKGTLPEGLSFNADGTISGIASASGSTEVTVTLTADNWITTTAVVTINVEPIVSITEEEDGWKIVLTDKIEVAEEAPTTDDPVGTSAITGVVLTVNAPEGMTFDEETGLLSGAPSALGLQDVEVKVTVTTQTVVKSGWWSTKVETKNTDIVKTISVGEEAPELLFRVSGGALQYSADNGATWQNVGTGGEGGSGNFITNIAKTSSEGLVDTYTITMSDGTEYTFTVTNGKDGENGDGGSGCGGSVAGIASFTAALLLAGAAIVFASAKRSKS